jgi:hypothetical protein
MGSSGSKSSSKSTIINDFTASTLSENIMNCRNTTTLQQKIKVMGDGNILRDFGMDQSFKLSSECEQDVNVSVKLKTDLANSIKQAAEAQNVALFGGLGGEAKAEAESYVKSSINQSVTTKAIADIINTTNAKQIVEVAGNYNILENFDMSQVIDLISKNSQKVINNIDIVAKAKNKIEQKAKSTVENPLDAVTDMIKAAMDGLMSPFKMVTMIVGGVVGLIILMIAYAFLGGKSDTKRNTRREFTRPQYQQPQYQQPQYQQPQYQQPQYQQPQYQQPQYQQPEPQQPQYQQPEPQQPQYQQPEPQQPPLLQPEPQQPPLLQPEPQQPPLLQ